MTREYEQLLDLIRGRRSVRRFSDRPVDAAQVDQVLEAARWAPSAGNRQGWRFLVVRTPERISAMGAAVRQASARLRATARAETATELDAYLGYFFHFEAAPVVIVPIHRTGVDLLGAAASQAPEAGPGVARSTAESIASVSAAIMNLLLAAHALGLGACWMTGPLVAAEALASALDVPQGWEIAAVIPLGHPAETPAAPGRRPLGRIRKEL